MSMLSMQIDRLRSYADLYDGTTKPEMTKELQRPYLAQELRVAADTIWQLRDDLQQANAEIAKLRERVSELDELLPENGRWFSAETVEAYVAENAKLRELIRELYEIAQPEAPSMFEAEFADRMRELGVKAD